MRLSVRRQTSSTLLVLLIIVGLAACSSPGIVSLPTPGTESRASPSIVATALPSTTTTTTAPTPRLQLDPQHVEATIPLPWAPTEITAGEEFIWVASTKEQTVARIEPTTNQLVGEPVRFSEPISTLAVGENAVWVAGGKQVTRLDPATGKVIATITLNRERDLFRSVIGAGSVWLIDLVQGDASVYRVDPQTNRFVGDPIHVGTEALGIAYGAGSVWAIDHDESNVVRIDPERNQVVATIQLPFGEPHYTEFGAGAIWIADLHANRVWRLDPQSNQVADQPIAVPFAPEYMTASDNAVWVLPFPWRSNGDDRIVKIDAATNQVVEEVHTGGVPIDAAVSDDSVWVTVQNPNMILRITPSNGQP